MIERIGIIGGSGLYDIAGFRDRSRERVRTPFGDPSSDYVLGVLEDRPIAFLPRHAPGHRIMPHELNSRANIYGFKELGVRKILAFGAVGSMKEEHHPEEMIIVDQFIDMTKKRPSTFFGDGLAAHIPFAQPVCPWLSEVVYQAGVAAGVTVKKPGTYVCMEGPQFSTLAESNMYRSWGVDVIGMTALPEAKLAREAEICYVSIAMVTDYDCWHQDEEAVTAEAIINVMKKNSDNAKKLLRRALHFIPDDAFCDCNSCLANSFITPWDLVPLRTMRKLHAIVSKYASMEVT